MCIVLWYVWILSHIRLPSNYMLNIESFLGCDTYTSPLSTCLSMSVFSSCFCFYHSFFPACLCVSIFVQVDICETRVLAPVFENRNAVSLPSNNYIRIYVCLVSITPCLFVFLSLGLFPHCFPVCLDLPSQPHPHTCILIHTPPSFLFLRGVDWSGLWQWLVCVHELSDTLATGALNWTRTNKGR